MRLITGSLTVASLLAAGVSSQARELDYFDANNDSAQVSSTIPDTRREMSAGVVVSSRDAFGTPRFLWALRDNPTAYVASGSAAERAQSYLQHYAAVLGLSSATLKTAVVKAAHQLSNGSGSIVQFVQRVEGIEVFATRMNVLLDGQGGLLAMTGQLAPDAGYPQSAKFKLPYAKAMSQVLDEYFGTSQISVREIKVTEDGSHWFELARNPSSQRLEHARVKRVYYRLGQTLVPAYYADYLGREKYRGSNEAYAVVISAEDGRVLHRRSLTNYDAFKYRVWAEPDGMKTPLDNPSADFTPHPTGAVDKSAPTTSLIPALVEMDGFNTNSEGKPDPWLLGINTETNGNNVDAYADRDQSTSLTGVISNDGFTSGDLRATVTAPLTFDRTTDLTKAATADENQVKASVTQLFYTVNWMHDYWYDSGFDEQSGNCQKLNYGRGGLQSDALRAEAQDSVADGARDNANMSTLPEGISPRMQMYLWNNADKVRTITAAPPIANFSGITNIAAFTAHSFNVTAPAVLANDGIDPGSDGCENLPADVAGKIVVVEGLSPFKCSAVQRAQKAQAVNAAGVVYVVSWSDLPVLLGSDPRFKDITIPQLQIGRVDGELLKAALSAGPVNLTLVKDPNLDIDGGLDSQLVAHEWGHSLHRRLVDCGSPSCFMMSEGWADFIALHMTVRPNDPLNGLYPVASYSAQNVGLGNGYYFGLRRYPYSTDTSKNPHTFKNITNGVALPAGIPWNATPIPDNAQEHNAGEVWASSLHEGQIALIKDSQGVNPRFTWQEAHRRMANYVVAGMKLAPTEPSFTEQRDAILAAAWAHDPKDYLLLADGFSKRGLGSCAVAPPPFSFNNMEAVEAFGLKGRLEFVSWVLDESVKSCDKDGRLDVGESGKLRVTIRNAGAVALQATSATITTTFAGLKLTGGGSVQIPELAPLVTHELLLDATLDASVAKMELVPITVTLTNNNACQARLEVPIKAWVNSDDVEASSSDDNVEATKSAWTTQQVTDVPFQIWQRLETQENNQANYVWHAENAPAVSDAFLISPLLEVAASGNFVVQFSHSFRFDGTIDGAIIEISTNDGQTWEDVLKYVDPGYTGVIPAPPDTLASLKGRRAFTGTSPDYPVMKPAIIDFGTQLASKSVRLRFHIGTDQRNNGAPHPGWTIDDLHVTGITNKPFTSVRDDAQTCKGTGGAGGAAGAGGTAGMGGGTGGTAGRTGGTGGTTPPPTTEDDGCDCTVAGGSASTFGAAASLLLLSLPFIRRRKSGTNRN